MISARVIVAVPVAVIFLGSIAYFGTRHHFAAEKHITLPPKHESASQTHKTHEPGLMSAANKVNLSVWWRPIDDPILNQDYDIIISTPYPCYGEDNSLTNCKLSSWQATSYAGIAKCADGPVPNFTVQYAAVQPADGADPNALNCGTEFADMFCSLGATIYGGCPQQYGPSPQGKYMMESATISLGAKHPDKTFYVSVVNRCNNTANLLGLQISPWPSLLFGASVNNTTPGGTYGSCQIGPINIADTINFNANYHPYLVSSECDTGSKGFSNPNCIAWHIMTMKYFNANNSWLCLGYQPQYPGASSQLSNKPYPVDPANHSNMLSSFPQCPGGDPNWWGTLGNYLSQDSALCPCAHT